MTSSYWRPFFLTVLFVACAHAAKGRDYVRLKTGQIVEGAVIRQDTTAIVMTTWENRNLSQPPLLVFAKEEVQSVWFTDPASEEVGHVRYRPHVGGFEFGGSFLFQTWAESDLLRQHLILLEVQGGYDIVPALGFDLAAAFTVPLGGASDSAWHHYDPAYQVTMSIVAHPFVWKGIVPYALAGGGAAVGTPVNNMILSSAHDVRSLINAGLGLKWGIDHVGMRVEWRHHFYTWTPDAVDSLGRRVAAQSADASMIRVGLFYFR